MPSNNTFYALSEPTRRSILEMLASEGKLPATTIYKKFNTSHPAISQHLKVLREARLVFVEKRGKQRLYQINPNKMSELEDWAKKMSEQWNQRFDALEKVLEKEKKKITNNLLSQL